MPLEDQTGVETADQSQPPSDATPVEASTPDAEPPSSSGPDVEPPSSSGSEDQPTRSTDGPATLEDAISAAMDAEAPSPDANPEAKSPDADTEDADADAEPAEGTSEADEKASEEGSDSDDGEVTEKEISRYGKNAQKRIRQLLQSRADMRQELESHKTDASSYRQIREYMKSNDLVDQEVADLFQLGADLKSGDPARLTKFLDRVMPFVQVAMEATGRALPADLRKQVEDGEMTEAAARQMSQTRTSAAHAQRLAQSAQQREQAQQAQASQSRIFHAVTEWQNQVRKTDPDFELKAKAMTRVAQALVAERGRPKTPEEGVEFAKAAYEEASQLLKASRPTPKATRPAPTSQTAPRSGLAPTATSIEAIINQALDG